MQCHKEERGSLRESTWPGHLYHRLFVLRHITTTAVLLTALLGYVELYFEDPIIVVLLLYCCITTAVVELSPLCCVDLGK